MSSSSCFSSVSTPTVLPLNVDSFLSHKPLSIVLNLCIAANREVHYVWLYHSVSSVSVYNILLVLLLSLSINSWRSFQFTWNFSSSLLWAQLYSITNRYHNLFSHSPIEGHSLIFQFFATTKSVAISIFCTSCFPNDPFGVYTQQCYGWVKGQTDFYSPLSIVPNCPPK